MVTRLMPNGSELPRIIKTVGERDVSLLGAFEYGTELNFTVEVPRKLGASAVVLRAKNDDTMAQWDMPLSFVATESGIDTYTLEVDLGEWCKNDGSGLFYYEFLFLRGFDTLFSTTENNLDLELTTHSDNRFRLLVYEKDFKTPEWFSGGVMYHVFVDRFCRGEGEVGERDDVIINDDWVGGIPQYPENRGDRYSNNVFFGGNLWGVAEKLDYLKSLGVTVIYLSPIFKAYSNHKYDTGNYLEIDEMFGGEAAFRTLIDKAESLGIKIILDGVFNHTGDDSLYFDRYSKYGGTGAYSNPNSAFRNWFHFKNYPEEYESWWGIDILPKLDLNQVECREFLAGVGGVADKYVKMGIGGLRLDVADELPNEFLELLRKTVKDASGGDGILIGEVWENAADKISYGRRRRYFRGAQLDSVMNYPLRNGILEFVRHKSAETLADILKEIYSSYPESVCHSLMNILGTHDTERVLTMLGQSDEDEIEALSMPNSVLARHKLSYEKRAEAIRKLKVASIIQYTVYGVPSVFYADEAGLEGYGDPFCRMPYPWGRECVELLEHYKLLGDIRSKLSVFADGSFRVIEAEGAFIAYERENASEKITVIANMSDKTIEFSCVGRDMVSGDEYDGYLPAQSAKIVYLKKET